MASSSQLMVVNDPEVVQEFDRDISEFLVSISGKFLGMNPNDLMQSTGLRQLIARNMRWFQNTPDWMKVVGLLVAKKFNGEVRHRNAMLEPLSGGHSYAPLLSSSTSSSSFVNEDVKEEEDVSEDIKQPLLPNKRSESIPFPTKKARKSKTYQESVSPEDHIPFSDDTAKETEDDMLACVYGTPLVVASSSTSSMSTSFSSNDEKKNTKKKKTESKSIQPKRKAMVMMMTEETEKANDIQMTVVDGPKKKHRKVSSGSPDTPLVPIRKEPTKKKVSSRNKSVAAPESFSSVDVIDVDADDEREPENKSIDSLSCVHSDDVVTFMQL